jgi:gamma-glutamylcyclotransferase (GGCT)/AIG2-like uncharacterized protein YtfP
MMRRTPGLPAELAELAELGEPGDLFAYGTLQFPGILSALLRRIPEHAAGTVPGWRVAALTARSYPGMVPAGQAAASGILLTGLTMAEWRLIDSYEDDYYELRQLTLTDGRPCWTYAWVRHADVAGHDWSAPEFAARHLADFTRRCRAWREHYDAAGRPGRVTGQQLDPASTRADRGRQDNQ